MTETETNPYKPPVVFDTSRSGRTIESADNEVARPVRSFRWRTIPAALSWFVSAALFVLFLVWSFEAFISAGSDDDDRRIDIVAACTIVTLLTASILNFVSGRRWLAKKWRLALALHGASALLVFGTVTLLKHFMLGY